MNFKPLILVAALTLAAGAHAAPKAKATKARANKTPVVSATTMPAVQSSVHLSDGIAAVVDNEVITHRQVEQAVAQARQTLPKGTQMDAHELRQILFATRFSREDLLNSFMKQDGQPVLSPWMTSNSAYLERLREATVDLRYIASR